MYLCLCYPYFENSYCEESKMNFFENNKFVLRTISTSGISNKFMSQLEIIIQKYIYTYHQK